MPARVNIVFPQANSQGERLQRLFKAHAEMKRGYGESYRAVKGMLDVIRTSRQADASADDPDVVHASADIDNLEQAIADLRKAVVLDFKRGLQLIELAINELVPGTFDHDDGPLQSDDRDKEDLKDDLVAIGTAAGAIAAAAALVPGGQGVAAFSAGFAAGIFVGVAALEVADAI